MSERRPAPADPALIRKLAREKFGYDHLRFGQEEAIRHVLAGHDTLSVMPTGSGKSAIYQSPASCSTAPRSSSPR